MANPTLEGLLNANNPQILITGANLSALANNALVLSNQFSNVTGDGAGGGFRYAYLKLHIDSMAVSAGGVIDGWLLTASDGTIYEQGDATHTPLRAVDFTFVPIVQTAAIDLEAYVRMPICATIKCLIRNNALGAAMPANTNGYVKAFYETDMYPNV